MNSLSLLSSKEIRKDGIYFTIKDSTALETRHHPDLIDTFYIAAVAINPNEQFYVFYERFNRKEPEFDGYGLNGVLRYFSKTILHASGASAKSKYAVSYNAHSLIANYYCTEFHKSVTCSLYSDNRLKVETFINHLPDNLLENKGSDFYDFLAHDDILNGTPRLDSLAFFPEKEKKSWWQF